MHPGQAKDVGRKRRRPALACVQCRKRKLRCDRTTPCSNCVRSKGAVCSYSHPFSEADSPTHAVQVRESLFVPSSSAIEATASQRPSSPPTTSQLEAPRSDSTKVLGPPTFNTSRTAATSKNLSTSSNAGPIVPRLVEDQLAEDPFPIIITGDVINDPTKDPVLPTVTSVRRAVVAKTRYFGPSHWMSSSVMFPRLFRILEKHATPGHTEIHKLLANGKLLARHIKRSGTTTFGSSLGSQLPSKDIADKLVNAYLRTFERVYRILHVPSFQTDYDRFWDLGKKSDDVFIIKLQLTLAIGACFYDETFSLRSLAMQWIQEAQLWLAAPISEKSNMTISGLQILCLLHLARETTNVNADTVWISSGALLRTAMNMGLHRDPVHLPPMSNLQAELRRRLWSTILELTLQSSIASGGLPLFSMDDFDTEPPANLDDEQLMELEDGPPMPKPSEILTDTSFLIILRNILAVRLDIANFVNSFRKPPVYEETLRHNAELVAACRDLARAVHSYQKTNSCPSAFQVKLLELLTRPLFIALHMPFMEKALENPVYYFSRKAVVETSLKLYRSCCPAAVPPVGQLSNYPDQRDQDDYVRLCICGSGPFRNIMIQAQMMIAIETISQLEEDTGMGDSSPSMDLLHALRQMRSWTKQRLYSGETNIKSHMCVAALESNVNALLQGLGDEQMEQLMAEGILESLREGTDILESFVGWRLSDMNFDQPGEMDVEEMYDGSWAWDNLING